MIIENPPDPLDSVKIKRYYFENGAIFDTWTLIVYLLDKYVRLNPSKEGIIKKIQIRQGQITCLNVLMSNFNISKIIITPHILAEFLNKIKSNLKEDYQNIKRECLEDLRSFGEIRVRKNDLIKHSGFIQFGNDISLILANEQQIKQFKYSCILSFDGRFIETFFRKTRQECIAFKLDALQYYFYSN